MPFLLLFFVLFLPASVYLRHGLIVTATKAFLLCAIPAGTYRVQSPGFLKIVYIAKVNAEISDFFISYYYSRDDSSEPFPVTASEPVVNSPPTQEGKQTSHIQTAIGPKLEDKKIVLLTVGLAKNAAVGVRGRILSR